jgi:hypothetical protein
VHHARPWDDVGELLRGHLLVVVVVVVVVDVVVDVDVVVVVAVVGVGVVVGVVVEQRLFSRPLSPFEPWSLQSWECVPSIHSNMDHLKNYDVEFVSL